MVKISGNPKYCIGWIPHLIGDPFLTNRWTDLISADIEERERAFRQWKQKNPQKNESEYEKEIITIKREDEKFFYKLKFQGQKELLGHLFNIERIVLGNCSLPETLRINNIKKTLQNSVYVANCRSVDDTLSKERVFFVFRFSNPTFNKLEEVILFKRQKLSHDPKDIVLLYRASITIDDITKQGFITLHTTHVSDIIANQNAASDIYSIQAFMAIRDVLHCHTHHHCHTPNSSTSNLEPGDVPDNLIPPVLTYNDLKTPPSSAKVTSKILEEYKFSIQNHIEIIADLVQRTESIHRNGIRKIQIRNGYPEILAFINQAKGIITYTHQLIQDMKYNDCLSDREYVKLKDTIQNVHHMFKEFQDSLECRFQVNITGISELLLVITALLTIWLIILEMDKILTIPVQIIEVLLLFSVILPTFYVYFRFFKKAI